MDVFFYMSGIVSILFNSAVSKAATWLMQQMQHRQAFEKPDFYPMAEKRTVKAVIKKL